MRNWLDHLVKLPTGDAGGSRERLPARPRRRFVLGSQQPFRAPVLIRHGTDHNRRRDMPPGAASRSLRTAQRPAKVPV